MIYGWRIVSNGPPAVLLYRKVRRAEWAHVIKSSCFTKYQIV